MGYRYFFVSFLSEPVKTNPTVITAALGIKLPGASGKYGVDVVRFPLNFNDRRTSGWNFSLSAMHLTVCTSQLTNVPLLTLPARPLITLSRRCCTFLVALSSPQDHLNLDRKSSNCK